MQVVKRFITTALVLYSDMAKVTTLSPVHVATGNIIEAPSYHAGPAYKTCQRYRFIELLGQMPSSVLFNPSFLNQLSSKQPTKQLLYREINKYVNYHRLSPLYSLTFDLSDDQDFKQTKYDVSEQIKDLDQPYIPGSSVKGALLNAWIYWVLKTNPQLVDDRIRNYIQSCYKKTATWISLLFDQQPKNNKNDLSFEDFEKELYGCLSCDDIHFQEMEMFCAIRIGAASGTDIPLPYRECIKSGQTSNAVFFTIDTRKIDLLRRRCSASSNHSTYDRIINMFQEESIRKACNIFTSDMLKEEMQEDNVNLYESTYPINQQVRRLLTQIEQIKTKDEIILRIGNSTNWNFKCVSLFVKKNYPKLFQENFDRVFSPMNKEGKTKAVAEIIPYTRVIYEKSDGCYLPGFIKVDFHDS